MRVSPRDLQAVRLGGLVTRYAVLGAAAFVIVDMASTGSAGTPIEEPCEQEHWGLVLAGELTAIEGHGRRTLGPGTAFYAPPGPTHRFQARGRAVVAGFAPVSDPLDVTPDALRARGIEIIRRPAPVTPRPTTIRVDALPTHVASSGRIDTEAAVMGSWLFTWSRFGTRSGYADIWCDLPHWGMVLDGDVVIRWEDGDLELLSAGDAFHCPPGAPGHRLEVADGASVVDYTPIALIDDPGVRRAPRLVAALGGEGGSRDAASEAPGADDEPRAAAPIRAAAGRWQG